MKSYSELIKLDSFKERFDYLKLDGNVGEETFGHGRHLNQKFYKGNPLWKNIRDEVIARDRGNDLGVEGHVIHGAVLVHHLNPITSDDIIHNRDCLYDMENLISTQLSTHNPIHYGGNYTENQPIVRTKGDTSPWLNKKKRR